jgi:hypothetical protein
VRLHVAAAAAGHATGERANEIEVARELLPGRFRKC